MSPIAHRHRRRACAGPLALAALACAACTLAPRPAERAEAPVVAAATPKATPKTPASPPPAPAKPAPAPSKAESPRGVGDPRAAAPAKTRPAKPPAPPASAAAPPQRAPLDLQSLEARLKETPAIGVMTKLSLKNQVDDLLAQFRDYYEGRLRASLADLRRPFDLLLMKVLSLLQDADPALAREVHDSRDALWALLTDPERFRKLSK